MLRKSFVNGTIILIITGLIVRTLGFIYRIYLSNLIGAEGMGLFGLVFPIYSLVILTLTAGVSIGVSRMVAEEFACNRLFNLRRITRLAAIMVVSIGIAVALFMFIFAGFITTHIMRDARTYYSLMVLIPCIPVIAMASVLKGYFYGLQDIVPTALSQVTEQIVRIGFVMITAGWALRFGLEYACAIATLGMALGEISNLMVLFLLYKFKRNELKTNNNGLMRKRTILKELFKISIPISANRLITSAISAFEALLIPARLIARGMTSQTSMIEFGRMTGMAMPILFFPSLITSSLATMLVPAISQASSINNKKSVEYKISKSIQLAAVIGVVFAGIFICYPNQIGSLIYKKEKIGDILYYLSFSCVFLYLQQTLLGILNGLGLQTVSLINSLVGYAIRIGFVYFCIPLYGILGYIWGIIASSAIVCFLNIFVVVKTTAIYTDLINWFLKPGIIGLFLILTNKYIYSFFALLNPNPQKVIVFTIIGNIFIAIGLMIVFGILKKGELKRLLPLKSSS